MTKINKCILAGICAVLAGCSGLNAQRRAAKEAQQQTLAAESSVKAARQAGAASCGAKELKLAETDLQFAKSNLAKKDYSLALNMAKSADTNAGAALKKCEEVKRRKKK
jgi:uncharacterized lipoprotein